MKVRMLATQVALPVLAIVAVSAQAHAADFDWMKFKGRTVTFLANNNPVAQALLTYKADFEKLTGMTLKVDGYQEQQMRQRLVTVMNANSDEVDVFMTLPSREGEQFAAAGWYGDLTAMAKNEVAKEYDPAGLSQALLKAATFGGKLTSMPMNIEGPIFYYRTDIFKKCGIEAPKTIKDVEAAAEKIKTCDSAVTPFVSRGLKPAVAYTFSNMLHNIGGSYIAGGKSNLCSAKGKEALDTYSRLLRDFGPPGVVNYSFQQISALYRSGRAAMAFESSNELRTVMEGGARLKDTGLLPFPAGEAGQVPTTIGWGMAVSSHSKQPDAAWYFVQWATSPEVQKKMALQGIAPPRPSVAKDPEYRKWIDEEPVRKEWQAALDVLATKGSSEVGYPIIANPESREFIGQAVQDLILKQKPIDQACADADKALDALIAQK
ncbi:carbohydrate ABC transporter substrate-binding protein, CUT1 family [Bradyrhizobium brasilense]|uniref:Carbohydrate ABC transporter substrate-binding protein, CUT1 family n=1 Tax=Bradyrhizobium brasilense TaxID=1419277 RepID=A0A1G7DBT2_9BRAD|nr:sugar ABC transporter substrate-binding protein [Bradyrhizobium brasilense]SDE48386.1 carbohydrate ABC transporter substrate-binding protein, CUT1 family [Bradyrhizobium brasilense]